MKSPVTEKIAALQKQALTAGAWHPQTGGGVGARRSSVTDGVGGLLLSGCTLSRAVTQTGRRPQPKFSLLMS